jgi:hypothetical protein
MNFPSFLISFNISFSMIFLEGSNTREISTIHHNTRSPEGNEISAQLKPGGLRRYVKKRS